MSHTDSTTASSTATLAAYLITWKRHPFARTLHTWTRFAPDDVMALLSAAEAITNETAGEGVIVSVEPTADPRNADPLDAIEPEAVIVATPAGPQLAWAAMLPETPVQLSLL